MEQSLDGQGRLQFVVTDLRQWEYCRRVVYYQYCMPLLRPATFKMELGTVRHEEEKGREQRRGMRLYGVPDGERVFDLYLEDAELRLGGKPDLVIVRDAECIPVEYKNSTRKVEKPVKMQLAAYALLLEANGYAAVQRGMVYAIPRRRVTEVALSARWRKKVRAALAEMRDAVEGERMPKPPKARGKCVDCEYRRFCNDV